MGSNWSKTALGDIMSFTNGKSSPPRHNGLPYPVYGANGIIGFSDKENANEGTIVIGRVGSYCGSIYYSKQKCWVTDNAIRANAQRYNDPQFLFYLLGTLNLNNMRGGSGQPLLNQTILSSIFVSVPPYNEQRAIASVLGTMDDKIELNRKMNETMEAMARAIFKSWFVDFDPIPGHGPHKEWQNSPLGRIPKGWEILPLLKLVALIGGGTPKTKVAEYWGGDIPWFSVVDAPSESDIFVIDTEKHVTQLGVDCSSTKILRKGTTIISARGTVGKCALVGRPMAMNQSCYGIQGTEGRADYFTYYTIRHQIADLQRSGHGSVFNTITRDTFESLRLVSPPAKLTRAFDRAVNQMMELILSKLEENTTLAAIRDALLPKLLLGEIRIQDAEKFVEANA